MRLHTKAKRNRSLRFNNLLHPITPVVLIKAYNRLNRKSARGVDGESWTSYGKHLSERIKALHKRIHTQGYNPKPVLRIWLPKLDGSRRPIGITSEEDKIVQQALVWVLETIYEADFLGFSYGFRPNRNQHQALNAAYIAITQNLLSAPVRRWVYAETVYDSQKAESENQRRKTDFVEKPPQGCI